MTARRQVFRICLKGILDIEGTDVGSNGTGNDDDDDTLPTLSTTSFDRMVELTDGYSGYVLGPRTPRCAYRLYCLCISGIVFLCIM